MLIARSEASSGYAHARVNVTGGVVDLSSNMWNSASHRQGLILASMGKYATASAWGELYISGGAITNSGQLILGAGFGGTGTVVQTGGIFRQRAAPGFTAYPTTIGFGGGYGYFTMEGGRFESVKNVYVGGQTTADLGYTPDPAGIVFTNNSFGLLRIDGGSFTVTNANLYLGRYGKGTLIIGTNGICSAKDIVLDTNTQSVVRFEFSPDGTGSLTASEKLTVNDGAQLEVDTTAYTGDAARIKLIDCATREGTFAPEDITVVGRGFIRQDKDEDIWLYRIKGTFLGLL